MAETAIPVVDPEDLQRVYELFAKYPNHGIGARLLTRHCKPGEDVQVLCQRTYLLTILATAPDDIRKRLSPWLNEEGVWSAGASRVAARFPMDWYQRRVFYAEELDAFLKLLKAEGECGN